MFKKLATLLLASVLVLSTASVARAQTPPPNQWVFEGPQAQYDKIMQSPDNEVNFNKYVASVANGVLGYLNIGAVTPGGSAPSATSDLGNLIALMAGNQPARTYDYLAYMGAKAGFVDQAYAQSGGFGVLSPVRDIWVATRNVAYLITSLTLVVIGFMIMMRKKLDAQTVIGIQQALPSIVITLLLITFSYAIAGLMIDLLYFILYFIVQLLGDNIFKPGGAQDAIDFVTKNSVFTVVLGGLFGAGGIDAKDASEAIATLIDTIFTNSGILGTILSGLGNLVSGSVGGLIISGALLFTMVKLFFTLLTSYAMFIIAVVFGPLMLMTNAVPGSNAFGTWIKNLAGNAAVFPATAIFIILAAAMMGGGNPNFGIKDDIGFGGTASSGSPAWVPPLLFGFGAPTTTSTGKTVNPIDALMSIIGLGMLMLTPQFVEMVKKAFQTAGGEGYGSAIGQALQYGASGRYAPTGLGMGLGGAAWRLGPGYGLERGQAARGLQLERSMRGLPEFTSGRGGELERAMQQRYGKGFSRLLGWAGRAFGK